MRRPATGVTDRGGRTSPRGWRADEGVPAAVVHDRDVQRPDRRGVRRSTSDPLQLVSGGEGVLTGTVVCAAAIAYSAGHVGSTVELSLIIVGTVLIYWLAHLHARTISASVSHGHHPLVSLRLAARETWPVAGASVFPVVVLVVAELLGASLATAAWAALVTTILLLTAYSYLAGARSGLGPWGRLASAAVGAALGVLVAGLKVLLH